MSLSSSKYTELTWRQILNDNRIVELQKTHKLTDVAVAAILNSVNVAIIQNTHWTHSPETLVCNDGKEMLRVLNLLEFREQCQVSDALLKLGMVPFERLTHTQSTAVYFAYPRTPVSLQVDLTCYICA